LFKIISDYSIGANLRRIEAVTGMYAYNYLEEKERLLRKISTSLEVNDDKVLDTLIKMKDDIKKKNEELVLLQIKVARKEIIDKSGYKPSSSGLKIIDYDFSKSGVLSSMEINNIGRVGDEIVNYFKGLNTFTIFGNMVNNKAVIILNSTKDLVKKGIDCGRIAKEISKKLNGGGGGKPHYAQMGFPDKGSIGKAIDFVKDKVIDILKE